MSYGIPGPVFTLPQHENLSFMVLTILINDISLNPWLICLHFSSWGLKQVNAQIWPVWWFTEMRTSWV